MRTAVVAGLMFVLCNEWAWAQPGQPPTTTTTTIEVVNDKKKFDMLVPAHRLLVVVRSGTVAAIDVRVTELAGGSVDPNAVTFSSQKGTFAGGNWIEVPVAVNAAPFARLGPGSFDLVGVVQASDANGKVLVSVPLSMTLVRAERQLTPPSTPVALRVRRAWPFSTVDAVHCLQLRATPAGPLASPAVESGELLAGTPAAVVPNAMVTGRFEACPSTALTAANSSPRQPSLDSVVPPLVVRASLPRSLTAATATLRIDGPDIKPNSTIALQIQAKDIMLWPLLVVLAAVALSRYVHNWVQSGRTAALNLAEMNAIADDLQTLEVLKSGALDQAKVSEVRRLLAEAARLQDRGDVVAAGTSLTNARKKLDELIVAAGGLGARGIAAAVVPAVVIETPVADRTTGRALTFSVADPIPPGAIWQLGVDGAFRTLDVVADPRATPAGSRVSIAPLQQPGVYAVRLAAGGDLGEATTFRVDPALSGRILRRVRQTDLSIDLLAAALTALIMTVAISELATFGTFRDYVLQFAGAFGVTESIKGFANTLATVRKV
jgi:hypothetical protein